jgi:hypothetical protein
MTIERVAQFAKMAANDSGILAALQNNPENFRHSLQLSEPQVRALISASSFTTDKPVRTTSLAEDPVGDLTKLMNLGTLGTLLPPEGSGAFPMPAELPPTLTAPITTPPRQAPKVAPAVHGGAPPKPQVPSSGNTPVGGNTPGGNPPLGTAPSSPSRTPTPQAGLAPTGQPTGRTPISYSPSATVSSNPVQSTPSPGNGGSSPGYSNSSPGDSSPAQGSSTADTGNQVAENSAPAQSQPMSLRATQMYNVPESMGRCGCGCSCDVGMIAVVAQVSATAQAAITAITAIAGMQ